MTNNQKSTVVYGYLLCILFVSFRSLLSWWWIPLLFMLVANTLFWWYCAQYAKSKLSHAKDNDDGDH